MRGEKPAHPTLFEFAIGNAVTQTLTSHIAYDPNDPNLHYKRLIDAFRIAGYDYALIRGRSFAFKTNRHKETGKASISLNEGFMIYDRESFDNYHWMEPEDADYTWLDDLAAYLPEGMKLVVPGPDGVFETVLALIGHDNMCYMLADDPELVKDVFDGVGSRYLKYYETCAKYDVVGAMMADDDWGFNTQTFLSVNDMKKYILPWHKKIAEVAHRANKPIILHSCGNIEAVMDDVIYDIRYDARHSFEDNIIPVETAYEKYYGKIALLGGIDVDFLTRSTPEMIYERSCAMLKRTKDRGGYALGSGNSIPDYVPAKNYFAMIAACLMNNGI